jgi:hypothetical protein
MGLRLFIEVDGEQITRPFSDFGQCLVAHLELALQRGGRVVSIHREEVPDVAPNGAEAPARPHRKGEECSCKPLAFHVTRPRRILLPSEVN